MRLTKLLLTGVAFLLPALAPASAKEAEEPAWEKTARAAARAFHYEDFASAERLLLATLAQEKNQPVDIDLQVNNQISLAEVLTHERKFEQATKLLNELGADFKRNGLAGTFTEARYHRVYSFLYVEMKRFHEALQEAILVRGLMEKVFGTDSPQYHESLLDEVLRALDAEDWQRVLKEWPATQPVLKVTGNLLQVFCCREAVCKAYVATGRAQDAFVILRQMRGEARSAPAMGEVCNIYGDLLEMDQRMHPWPNAQVVASLCSHAIIDVFNSYPQEEYVHRYFQAVEYQGCVAIRAKTGLGAAEYQLKQALLATNKYTNPKWQESKRFLAALLAQCLALEKKT